MPRNKVPRVYVLKGEIKAMGAAQIMVGLIQNALGTLWIFLHLLEDDQYSVGSVLMMVAISYLFVSGTFFISSGSSTVIQGTASMCQIVLAIVTNTISIFVAIIGMIIFGIEFQVFEAMGTEYIWSNMAGMMLLQISTIYTISELMIAAISVHWFRTVLRQKKSQDQSSSTSEYVLESPSLYSLEDLSQNK